MAGRENPFASDEEHIAQLWDARTKARGTPWYPDAVKAHEAAGGELKTRKEAQTAVMVESKPKKKGARK